MRLSEGLLATRGIFPLLLLSFTIPSAFAIRICTADPAPADNRHEFQAWGGYSAHSGGPISITPNTHFEVGGLLYSRRCWSWNKVSVSYNVGFMPVATVKQPLLIYTYFPTPAGGIALEPITLPPGHSRFTFISGFLYPRRSVYGFAGTPIGFTFDFLRSSRVYPYVQLDGGLIKSTEPVPLNLPRATSGNFLLSLGGGMKVRLGKSLALSTGYKLMHVSNAGRTYVNPGLDSNVIFAGISLLK